MKILKKINKGLILTIIVVLVLAIYLVNVEKQRKADKDDINKVCEEFIDFADKYLVLPEEMQNLTEPISEKKEKEYTDEIKTELEKIMISNEEAVKLQHQILVANLKNGYNTNSITSKLNKEITKITNYEFEENQVTVTFRTTVTVNTKYLTGDNEEKESKNTYETSNDEIMLQKVEGKWKVVYSNLSYNNGIYYEDTMVVY